MNQTIPDHPRHMRWTLGIALLLLLVLLLLWFSGRGPGSGAACCGAGIDTTLPPVATDTDSGKDALPPALDTTEPTSATTASAFAARAADGKITLTGTVADELARNRAVDAATGVYGAGNVIDQLQIDTNSAARGWEASFADIFAWQKGVPDAGLDFDGQRWVLTGTVTSDAEKAERGERAKAFFGTDATIDNQIQVVAVAKNASDVQCGDRIAVAVNFASGSSTLNAEAKAVLDRVFDCLKDGRFEIGGHTDNTGRADTNQRLSLARAEASKAYLVSKGAKTEDLTTAGYGPDKPIANNATAEGRAQNRRIEFARR
jgi:OmpA-OmpF porin, OOP family